MFVGEGRSSRLDCMDILRRLGLSTWESRRSEELAVKSSFASLRACGCLPRRAAAVLQSPIPSPNSTVAMLRGTLASLPASHEASATRGVTPESLQPFPTTGTIPSAVRQSLPEGKGSSVAVAPPSAAPLPRRPLVPRLNIEGGTGASRDSAHSVVTLKTDADAMIVRVRAVVSGRQESEPDAALSDRIPFEPLQISVTRLGGIDVKRVVGARSSRAAQPKKKTKRELLLTPNAEGIELTSRLESARSDPLPTTSSSVVSKNPLSASAGVVEQPLPAVAQNPGRVQYLQSFRVLCARLVSYPLFDAFIILVIVWSCVNLTLDSAAVSEESGDFCLTACLALNL